MVPAPAYMASFGLHEKIYTQSLHSHALEMKCDQHSHLIETLSKEEDIRKLRIDIHILEDDNDELRDLLAQEEDRSDKFEQVVSNNLYRAEAAEGRLQEISEDLRRRENELAILEAEKNAMRHTTADATAALTEKLALTRELSILKPQLEHLTAQAACTEQLMTEKLALQRQVSEYQCEVENARREAKRAMAKRRNTGVEIAQEEQMEDLRRQLAKEVRARARAEEAADVSQADLNVEDVRKELAREKRARQKAEEKLEEAESATQVEDVRRDLLQEKKLKERLEDRLENLQIELEKEKKAAARAAKRADGVSNADEQAEDLREELAKEKKARATAEKKAEAADEKIEKATEKATADLESKKSAMDDKLNQFRNKLRTTKERLKDVEAELAVARAAATKAPAKKTAGTTQDVKKRTAAQMDTDATALGTPGDGPATKRSRAAANRGDKSTFSITPFLNKTASVMGGSDDEKSANEASPVGPSARHPLAQQPTSKSNIQKKGPASRKPKAPMLEMVTEDANEDVHTQGQENTHSTKIGLKTGDEPANAEKKAKAKKRRSMLDFQGFAAEPEMKKKRKLGGLGRTLFDEEDDGAPARGVPSKGIFGSKGFGVFGGKKAGGLLGAKAGVPLQEASGCNFSPLKRNRRMNLDDTLRG